MQLNPSLTSSLTQTISPNNNLKKSQHHLTSTGFDENAGGFGSQQTPSKPRRDYDSQTLIPVTVKMINEALSTPNTPGNAGDIILKDDRPLHMIKLVGAVRSHDNKSTFMYLDLEDGTGLLAVKVYNGREDGSGEGDPSGIQKLKSEAFREHQYVRVIGQVRDFDGSRQIIANDVRVLSSGDELAHHFCEVAYSYEKHLKRKAAQGQMFGGMGYGIGNMASGGGPPPQAGGNVISPNNMNMGGGGNSVGDAVIQFLQTEASEFLFVSSLFVDESVYLLYIFGMNITVQLKSFEPKANSESGIHVEQIKAALAGQGFGGGEVMQAVSDLSNEGHIYSTIDENHYLFAS
jgi:replication factor A2